MDFSQTISTAIQAVGIHLDSTASTVVAITDIHGAMAVARPMMRIAEAGSRRLRTDKPCTMKGLLESVELLMTGRILPHEQRRIFDQQWH